MIEKKNLGWIVGSLIVLFVLLFRGESKYFEKYVKL